MKSKDEIKYAGLTDEGESHFSMRDILYILFRRKWQVLFFFLLVLSVGIYVAKKVPISYKSSSVFFIKPSRELQTPDPANPDSKTQIRSDQLMRSELEILKSRSLSEILVDKVGIDAVLEPYQIAEPTMDIFIEVSRIFKTNNTNPTLIPDPNPHTSSIKDHSIIKLQDVDPDRQMAINLVQRGLEVSNRDTLVTLEFTSPKPDYSQYMLKAILDAYQQRRVEVYRVSPKTYREQTDRIRKDLEKAEEELRSYQDKTGISSLELERTMLLDQISTLKEGITDASIIISASETRIKGIEKVSKLSQMGVLPGSREDQVGSYIRRELTNLMAQEAELNSLYPNNAYPVRKIREQIDRLSTALPVESSTNEINSDISLSLLPDATAMAGIDVALAQVDLNSEVARRDALKKELAACEVRLVEINKHEVPIKRLSRNVESLQASFTAYTANLQKAEVYASLDNEMISSISIVQPPTLALRPDTTLQVRIIAFASFFALFGSLAFAFFLNFLDHSLNTIEEVERRLGLPVLAAFPKSRNHRIRTLSLPRARIGPGDGTKKDLSKTDSSVHNAETGALQETNIC